MTATQLNSEVARTIAATAYGATAQTVRDMITSAAYQEAYTGARRTPLAVVLDQMPVAVAAATATAKARPNP